MKFSGKVAGHDVVVEVKGDTVTMGGHEMTDVQEFAAFAAGYKRSKVPKPRPP